MKLIKSFFYSKENTTKSKTLKLIAIIFFIFTLHITTMVYFEKLSFMDSLWLTFTTATTVGYGDISASTVYGRLSTIVLIYIFGLWIFAETIGSFVEHKASIVKLKLHGNWSWKMKNHLVILNVPCNNESKYLNDLVDQLMLGSSFDYEGVVVVTSKFTSGLPLSLQKKNILLVNESPVFNSALESASVKYAKHIIIISDNENDTHSDSKTFDLIHKVRDLNKDAYIVCECCFEDNKKRLVASGSNAVIKPIRAYPGMIVRALDTKGSEQFIEDIMSSSGNNVNSLKVSYKNVQWKEIVVANLNNGIPLGYKNKHGIIVFNPKFDSNISTELLFYLNDNE